MCFDGLEEPKNDPDVDGDNVEADLWPNGLGENSEEEGSTDGSRSKDENLNRVGVFGGETKGSGELVVCERDNSQQ